MHLGMDKYVFHSLFAGYWLLSSWTIFHLCPLASSWYHLGIIWLHSSIRVSLRFWLEPPNWIICLLFLNYIFFVMQWLLAYCPGFPRSDSRPRMDHTISSHGKCISILLLCISSTGFIGLEVSYLFLHSFY